MELDIEPPMPPASKKLAKTNISKKENKMPSSSVQDDLFRVTEPSKKKKEVPDFMDDMDLPLEAPPPPEEVDTLSLETPVQEPIITKRGILSRLLFKRPKDEVIVGPEISIPKSMDAPLSVSGTKEEAALAALDQMEKKETKAQAGKTQKRLEKQKADIKKSMRLLADARKKIAKDMEGMVSLGDNAESLWSKKFLKLEGLRTYFEQIEKTMPDMIKQVQADKNLLLEKENEIVKVVKQLEADSRMLDKKEDEILKAIERLEADQNQLDREEDAIVAKVDALENNRVFIDKKQAELDIREAAVAAKEKGINDQKKQFDQKASELKKTALEQAAFQKKIEDITAREKAVAKKEAQMQQVEARFEQQKHDLHMLHQHINTSIERLNLKIERLQLLNKKEALEESKRVKRLILQVQKKQKSVQYRGTKAEIQNAITSAQAPPKQDKLWAVLEEIGVLVSQRRFTAAKDQYALAEELLKKAKASEKKRAQLQLSAFYSDINLGLIAA